MHAGSVNSWPLPYNKISEPKTSTNPSGCLKLDKNVMYLWIERKKKRKEKRKRKKKKKEKKKKREREKNKNNNPKTNPTYQPNDRHVKRVPLRTITRDICLSVIKEMVAVANNHM